MALLKISRRVTEGIQFGCDQILMAKGQLEVRVRIPSVSQHLNDQFSKADWFRGFEFFPFQNIEIGDKENKLVGVRRVGEES